MRTHLSQDVFDKEFYPKCVYFYDFDAAATKKSRLCALKHITKR